MPEKFDFVPDKATYSYSPKNDVVEVSLDGGLSRRRRDIIGSSSRISCTWFLLPHEFQYFMAFYRSHLKRGALPFTIDLLLEQPFLEEVTAAFVANTLRSKQIGLSFEVEAELETVPLVDTDYDDMILLFYDETGSGENAFFNVLQQLTNFDLEVTIP